MGDAPGEEAKGEGDAERGSQEGRGGGEVRVDAPVEGGDAGHRIGSVAALAALLSVLTSIASAQIGKGGPSLAGEIVESEVVEWADGHEVIAGPANDLQHEGVVIREIPTEYDARHA